MGVEQAQALVDGGQSAQALELAMQALTWPCDGQSADEFKAWVAVVAQAWPATGNGPGSFWQELAANPKDTAVLAQLGSHLLDSNLAGPAATLLRRAWKARLSDPDMLSGYVCALEALGMHAYALEELQAVDVAQVRRSFVWRYLVAFNALMTGDVKMAAELQAGLGRTHDADFQEMAQELGHMLTRAAALEGMLGGGDLRGWHMVTTGAVLLQTADAGGGRFGPQAETLSDWRTTLELARVSLDVLNVKVPQVWAVGGGLGSVLAGAMARLLGVPVSPLPPHGSVEAGLVVAHKLDPLDDAALDAVVWHRANQVLLAHASPWQIEPPMAADVLGRLQAAALPPFGDDDLRDIDACVARVLEAPWQDQGEAVTRLCQRMHPVTGDAAAGPLMVRGERRRQRTDSPVR